MVRFVVIVVVVPAVAVPVGPFWWKTPHAPAANVPAIPDAGSASQADRKSVV